MLQRTRALGSALAGRNVAVSRVAIGLAAALESALLAAGAASGVQWPFFLVTGALVFVALGQYVGWALALAVEIVGVFALLAVLISAYPLLGLGVEWSNLLLCGLLAVAALAVISHRRRHLRLPVRASARLMAAASVVPLIGVAATVYSIVVYGGGHLSWAMGNDAVWNTVASRLLLTDGGLVAAVHPNPSPFSNALMASAMAGGRAAVPSAGLLEHDIVRIAQLWLALTFLACVLSALVVAREVSPDRRWRRSIAGVIGGAIPMLWYVSGFAFAYGFVNVTVSLVVLLSVWIIWKEAASSPFVGLCALLLAATVMLAVWAPLAPVPLALAALCGALQWHNRSALVRWPVAVSLSACAAMLVLYGLLVSLPDLRRDGSVLGAGGAMVPIGRLDPIVCAGVVIALTALSAFRTGRRRALVGVCAVVASGGAGVLWLSLGGAASGGWGYYPAKLAWILTILGIVIAAASVLSWLNVPRIGPVGSAGVFASAGAVVLLLAALVPPVSWSPGHLVPALTIGRVGGSSAQDAEASVLFAVSDPTRKTLLVQYFDDPRQEVFVNGWLIQQHSQLSRDPMRTNAYYLDTANLGQVCAVVRSWTGPVTVVTRNAQLPAKLGAVCQGADVTVRVVGTLSEAAAL